MTVITTLSPADAIAEIAASSPGPGVGAFFDLDGTLVKGFTAAVHVGDRIRRRQAGIGELLGVFEGALRYRFGRLEFEHLIVRAAGYLRGELLAELDELGERLFVERVAARLYSHMHDIVAGASGTRPHGGAQFVCALHPGAPGGTVPRHFQRAVQSF